jgi:ectoine hydroxylase-related dioxygenase (phytanoyl-CoA dioxygenase family)
MTGLPLAAGALAAYREQGLVVPEARVPAATLARLRAALDRLIEENPRTRPEHLVLRWGGGAAALPTHTEFLDVARDPAILDLIEPVLGPDIILWGAHVFCKPAGDGLEVPWHQDGQYWPIRPLATCTVWIAIDDSTRDNGCMRYIPGSHRTRAVYHHRLDERPGLAINQVLREDQFDEAAARDVELAAGQLSVHDVYLIHGSRANRSPRRRAGFAIRYMPATSLYDRSLAYPGGAAAIRQNMALRPIYLVRGTDRHGGNDFSIGHDRPYEVGVPDGAAP